MDFIAKDLVDTFFYTDYSQDREDSAEVVINGRTYLKFGTRTATTVVVNLYKIWDSSVKLNKYVAMMGISRQHPCDIKINKEMGIECANENAMAEPAAVITFDHMISYHEIKPFMIAYINSLTPEFIKTKEEILENEKTTEYGRKYPGDTLAFNKYNR